MSVLSNRAITALRLASAKFYRDTIVIKRQSATEDDGAGGQKPSSGDGWTTVATVKGLLVPADRVPRERGIASQIQAPLQYHVFVAPGSGAQAQDRLLIAERTFEVNGVAAMSNEPNESYAIRDRINCVELQK